MDKYEYKLKLDQMKSLTAEHNYEKAAEIADTINWNKIKNVNALVKVGEIYENTGRLEDSREILLMAYDRSPIGRMIIFRLAKVAIKMKNFDEAKDYYQEFVEIAPHDNLKYVLKYEICKAQGSDLQTLIGILEELKEQEYTEEWAFELACLYHKAGMADKCVEACDELVLWFGDGPYVERALELKMIYQPLNKQQEEKYRRFCQKREGVVEVRPEEELDSGEIVNEPVQIPDVQLSPERFNTLNLQEELKKSMQQIMQATEKETVADSMDNIKKLVEEIPYLQLPKETEEMPLVNDEAEQRHIETDNEIDDSLKINFKELLAEEHDGQIGMYMPEKTALEHQITGQMSIEEVLAEWEKTKYAAEVALEDARVRRLESAKARALHDAEEIMGRLNDIIPKLDAGVAPKDILQGQYLEGKPLENDRAAAMVANMNQILQEEIERISTETADIDKQLAQAAEAAGAAKTTASAAVSDGVIQTEPEAVAGLTQTAPEVPGAGVIQETLESVEDPVQTAPESVTAGVVQTAPEVPEAGEMQETPESAAGLAWTASEAAETRVTPEAVTAGVVQSVPEVPGAGEMQETPESAAGLAWTASEVPEARVIPEAVTAGVVQAAPEVPEAGEMQEARKSAAGLAWAASEAAETRVTPEAVTAGVVQTAPEVPGAGEMQEARESAAGLAWAASEAAEARVTPEAVSAGVAQNVVPELSKVPQTAAPEMPRSEKSEIEKAVDTAEIADEVSEMIQKETEKITSKELIQEPGAVEKTAVSRRTTVEENHQKVNTKAVTADTIDLSKVVTEQAFAEAVEHMVDTENLAEDTGFDAITSLSRELREIFTYFVSIKGMEEQLCQALTGAARHLVAGKDSSTGNMVIQGGSGSGKTVLATSMLKALQKETGKPKGKVGKIEASVLNKKDVASLLKKISGGCLIIEKAGDISKETAVRLSLLLKSDTSGLMVIMEDTHRGIEKALGRDEGFASRFSEKINIPIFTSDELVSFAKAYANELGYTIDEMGILALYNSISNIQKYDKATTLTEVKDIVDGAIKKAEKGGLRKAFSIITSRRYDDEDYVILREKDFGI